LEDDSKALEMLGRGVNRVLGGMNRYAWSRVREEMSKPGSIGMLEAIRIAGAYPAILALHRDHGLHTVSKGPFVGSVLVCSLALMATVWGGTVIRGMEEPDNVLALDAICGMLFLPALITLFVIRQVQASRTAKRVLRNADLAGNYDVMFIGNPYFFWSRVPFFRQQIERVYSFGEPLLLLIIGAPLAYLGSGVGMFLVWSSYCLFRFNHAINRRDDDQLLELLSQQSRASVLQQKMPLGQVQQRPSSPGFIAQGD